MIGRQGNGDANVFRQELVMRSPNVIVGRVGRWGRGAEEQCDRSSMGFMQWTRRSGGEGDT